MTAQGSRAERLAGWLAERRLLPPLGTPAHHPVFAAFPPLPAPGDGMDIDYLGVRTQPEMLPPYWQSPPPSAAPAPPVFDEEYFEWIDVLEAVEAARGDFTMVEFGAGYARWAARAWTAARRRGLNATIGVVEADPQHLAWARSHLTFNGVPARDVTFIESAAGAEAGETVFLVEMPPGAEGNTPREWYGQAVSWFAPDDATEAGRHYAGHELMAMPGGWHGVRVKVETLSAMLARFDAIDLADFDVQGVEAAVIREAIGPLTAKVARLHIGTHSRAIEAELAAILAPAGWRCLRAYPCLRWNRTEFGWIRFNDGVQTWINPAFARPPGRAKRPLDTSQESNDAYFETLRRKWVEVPGDSDKGERVFSSELVTWSDDRLRTYWEAQLAADSHIEIRGWYQILYRDLFRGRRVLEIGSGLGFDGNYFLSHGADWTFADIVASNLEVVRRIVGLRNPGAPAAYLVIDGMESFDSLARDYDFIWCNGSLINAPFAHAREESLRILRHLKPGGRWIELAYPPERWQREGAPRLADWGRMTDGERTPWCEWYDLEKLRRRMYPARLLPVLNMPFSSSNFIWFDLVFDSALPFQLPGTALPEGPPTTEVALAGLAALGRAHLGWRGHARTVETPGAIWSNAAHIDLEAEIAALRASAPPGFALVADIECTIEAGAIGIAFADAAGAMVSREVFADAYPHSRAVAVTLAPAAAGVALILRNVSGGGPSRVAISAITLRPAP